MNNQDIVKAITLILNNLNFDNSEIVERQLICIRDLLDTVLIDITKDKKCDHPEQARKCMNTMGDGSTKKKELCMVCGEMIESDYKQVGD